MPGENTFPKLNGLFRHMKAERVCHQLIYTTRNPKDFLKHISRFRRGRERGWKGTGKDTLVHSCEGATWHSVVMFP